MPNSLPEGFDESGFFEIANVSRETKAQIQRYAALLVKWQRKINLVSETTMPEMWSRHFYDSFQLKTYFRASKEETLRILDIGSGAGFPGLLLSMLDIGEFHMVESNGKKAAFMSQVIRDTGCNAVVHHERIEKLVPFYVDYITSRACASLDKLFELSRNFITDGTICLFLKGQIVEREIEDAKKNWAFDTELLTSHTDDSGMILKVSHIRALH